MSNQRSNASANKLLCVQRGPAQCCVACAFTLRVEFLAAFVSDVTFDFESDFCSFLPPPTLFFWGGGSHRVLHFHKLNVLDPLLLTTNPVSEPHIRSHLDCGACLFHTSTEDRVERQSDVEYRTSCAERMKNASPYLSAGHCAWLSYLSTGQSCISPRYHLERTLATCSRISMIPLQIFCS